MAAESFWSTYFAPMCMGDIFFLASLWSVIFFPLLLLWQDKIKSTGTDENPYMAILQWTSSFYIALLHGIIITVTVATFTDWFSSIRTYPFAKPTPWSTSQWACSLAVVWIQAFVSTIAPFSLDSMPSSLFIVLAQWLCAWLTSPSIWITFLKVSANEFNTDLSDWMLPAPLLLLGSGPSFCTVLAMCAHLFRCPYTLCVQISNISMWNNSMKIMLICGLHLHSRYSIVDFYIVLLHFRVVYRDLLWPTSTKCVQTLLKLVYFNRNSCTHHIHHITV